MIYDFDISGLVADLGYVFVMSGVSTDSYNNWGDNARTYKEFVLNGIPQEMDGTETEVEEGLLQKSDIIIFVDGNETNAGEIKTENYIRMSGAVTGTISGVFRIVNVVHNEGHIEIQAKRLNAV